MRETCEEESDDEQENSSPSEDIESSSEDTPPLVIDDNDLWIKYNALLNADSITEILYCVSDAGMFS